MKRSEINIIMNRAVEFFQIQNFHLPTFATWSIEDWKKNIDKVDMIVKNQLGWDITDYGSGNFWETGLIHFTIRNGNIKDSKQNGISYCEKIMIMEEGQRLPIHHHKNKVEDIINRAGGILEVRVYSISNNGDLGTEPLEVYCDGIKTSIKSGGKIELDPGESITITPNFYHSFSCKKGNERILIGEVSGVNDDYGDNTYLKKVKRFLEIEEDEPPIYLLYDDYEKYIKL